MNVGSSRVSCTLAHPLALSNFLDTVSETVRLRRRVTSKAR